MKIENDEKTRKHDDFQNNFINKEKSEKKKNFKFERVFLKKKISKEEKQT